MKKTLLSLAAFTSLFISSIVSADPYRTGDMIFRAGATHLLPDDGQSDITLNGAGSDLSLSLEESTQLGLNFAYFFHRSWAVEFYASAPFSHQVNLHGAFEDPKLADISQIPLNLSVLYYPDNAWDFKPYIGLGVNYTVFFSEEFTSGADDLGFSKLAFEDSIGYALQVGADYHISRHWSINASAQYIGIASDATFILGTGTEAAADVDLNPWVFSFMVGYKF